MALQGKPLPFITQFLFENHHLPAHVALFPWLWLVGAPLITRSASLNYWDPTAFVLRYLAFLSCELLLFAFLLLGLLAPYTTIYQGMYEFHQSTTELAVRLVFWLSVVVLAVSAIRRACQNRQGSQFLTSR